MSETSKLPWKIEIEHQDIRGRKQNITIVAPRGVVGRVGDTSMPGAMADAALIVRAVNAHEDLVAALQLAAPHICSLLCPSVKKDDTKWTHSATCEVISAALAKAGQP